MAATVELREIRRDSLAAMLDLAVQPEQEQVDTGEIVMRLALD